MKKVLLVCLLGCMVAIHASAASLPLLVGEEVFALGKQTESLMGKANLTLDAEPLLGAYVYGKSEALRYPLNIIYKQTLMLGTVFDNTESPESRACALLIITTTCEQSMKNLQQALDELNALSAANTFPLLFEAAQLYKKTIDLIGDINKQCITLARTK